MSIRPLPPEAASRIRSASTITSLNGAAVGLFKNALDAGASAVQVVLDYARGNCTVEDNGLGILPAEFCEGGGLGKPHFTSRWPPSDCHHGVAGTFLASLAQLSLLAISSRHHAHPSHSVLILHRGDVVARHAPAPPALRSLVFPHGTRVGARDVFGVMPVRVKQRGLLFGGGNSPAINREWDGLVRELVALVLAWEGVVDVRVREEGGQEVRLRSAGDDGLGERVGRALAQSRLADDAGRWAKVGGTLGRARLDGCVCLVPVANKKAQFISLGVRPLDGGFLYDDVNRVFAGSGFGITETGEAGGRVRKGIDRWPMFFFRIGLEERRRKCLDWGDVLPGRENELDEISGLLRTVAFEFLRKHRFSPRRPQEGGRPRRSGSSSPASPSSRRLPEPPLVPRSSPSRSGRRQRGRPAILPRSTDPFAGERGGVPSAFGPFPLRPKTVDPLASSPTRPTSSTAKRTLPDEASDGAQPSPKKPRSGRAVEEVLRARENPSDAAEPATPSVPAGAASGTIEVGSVTLGGKVTRQGLLDAKVIAQVDHKFIMTRLPLERDGRPEAGRNGRGACVVLIDQHAADERRRLEELMEGYFVRADGGRFVASTEALETSIQFEVSDRETTALSGMSAHFGRWGILYTVIPSLSTVEVSSLPPSILERCRQDPRLLADLMRYEVWNSQAGPLGAAVPEPLPGDDDDGARAWVARFHGCPRGILDLLNSRACRGAIMFNDPLSLAECEDLVRGLAACAFPFQCAHGRPVLAPLVNLDLLDDGWCMKQAEREHEGRGEKSVYSM